MAHRWGPDESAYFAMPQVTIRAADDTHPNRHPVTIQLFPVDLPSDGAPFGTRGRRIIVPASVAERQLYTLEGMALNCNDDLAGHNPAQKIGVITHAYIKDGWAVADGHLYAYDSPTVVEKLHALSVTGDLGASFESTLTYGPEVDGVLRLDNLVFTGATLMLRHAAAWQSTSVAAANSSAESMSPMSDPTKPAEQAATTPALDITALTALFTQLTTAVTTLSEKVGDIKAAAAPPAPQVTPEPAPTPTPDPAVIALQARLDEMLGRVQAAEERLAKPASAPQRRTIAHPEHLLGKFGVQAAADNSLEGTVTQIDSLREKGVIGSIESLQYKLLARTAATPTD